MSYACNDYDIDWDDDPTPAQEEPDCVSCSDSGCPACEPHPNGCDCAGCADSNVIAHEFLADIDAGLILVGPFADEPPF